MLSHAPETGTHIDINIMVPCFRTWITSTNWNQNRFTPSSRSNDWKKYFILLSVVGLLVGWFLDHGTMWFICVSGVCDNKPQALRFERLEGATWIWPTLFANQPILPFNPSIKTPKNELNIILKIYLFIDSFQTFKASSLNIQAYMKVEYFSIKNQMSW